VRYGYDVIADRLVERGRPIFGLLGSANLAVVARAVESGAEFFAGRHETASVSMAAGWALSTGEVGFVTTTGGPGVANSITGLTSAVRDRIPLVYLAGNSIRYNRPDSQDMDHEALLRPTGAIHVAVDHESNLLASFDGAFDMARGTHRPVVLDVPADMLASSALAQSSKARSGDSARYASQDTTMLDTEQVKRAASLLMEARRPVILAGRGALIAGADAALRKLGAISGALLASSLPAHGIFSGDPFAVGFAGGYALARTRELLRRADVVLAVGASLNHYTTDENRAFPDAKLLRADHDLSVMARPQADVALVGDARAVAEALVAYASDTERAGAGYRTAAVRQVIAVTDNGRDVQTTNRPDGIDPRILLRKIDQVIGARRRVIFDVGHFAAFPCQVFTVHHAGQLVPALGFASIGLALPTAIGVALGARDEDVVAVVGDGGMLMCLGEFESLARIGRRVIVVVMNDGAYMAEVHHLRRLGIPSDVAVYPRVDFAAIGRSLGVKSVTIRSAVDLEDFDAQLASTGPMLIDAQVDREVISDKFLRHG
jgi:thiamine pyrophosphate-dependent acetolactate synthase large subunit-like protein